MADGGLVGRGVATASFVKKKIDADIKYYHNNLFT